MHLCLALTLCICTSHTLLCKACAPHTGIDRTCGKCTWMHAGIDPMPCAAVEKRTCWPRTRGDRPRDDAGFAHLLHTHGDRPRPPLATVGAVFFAGLTRGCILATLTGRGLTRTRARVGGCKSRHNAGLYALPGLAPCLARYGACIVSLHVWLPRTCGRVGRDAITATNRVPNPGLTGCIARFIDGRIYTR